MSSLKSAYRKVRWSAFWQSFQLPEIELNELIPSIDMSEPPITEKLCLPPYEGPSDHNDVIPLLALVRSVNPRVVLELGTAHGATVANICAISNAKVYTVNALPEQIEGNFVTYILSREEIGYVYRKSGFADRVAQIYENTKKLNVTDYLSPHSVDLAIIDACHDADFVVNDFLRILPALHEESVVLFHDVHPSMWEHLGDSYIACMYLRKLGFDVSHLKDTWWGVWRSNHGKPAITVFQRMANVFDTLYIKVKRRSSTEDVLALRWLARTYLQ